MTNAFFTASGQPATGAFAASAPMRSEFSAVQTGFDKMPLLTAGTAVVVNGAGTMLANTVGTLALAGNFATAGAFSTTLVAGASVSITLPVVSGLTLATLTGTEILSNKTLVAPALGTPISGVATNLTGTAAGLTAGTVTTNANLTGPISSTGNTTSITSQTGTGTKFVVDTSPTLVTPTLGVATATSINKVAITAPATSATLTIADGKALAVSNSLTLAGSDSTTMTFPSTSATIARTDAANTFTGIQTFSTPIDVGSVAAMTATVGGGVPTPPNDSTKFLNGVGAFAVPPTGTGTVTTVSVATANGFAGTVANATTTPAITITTSINAPVLAGNGTAISAATTTGTGSTVVLQGTPTLTTPVLGVATATSIAIGGATISTNAMAVTGSVAVTPSGVTNPIAIQGVSGAGTYGFLTFNGSNSVTAGVGVAGGGDANLYLKVASAGLVNVSINNTSVASFASGGMTLGVALTYGGVALANSVTGTGSMVLSASPTFSGTIGGAVTFSGALTLSSALTYGGVTLSNSVTGTGSMVLSASPTFTGTVTVATLTGALASATTATTQAANDSSTKVATTAFANPANSLAASGYQTLPSGLILQWGITGSIAGAGSSAISFPVTFASALYSVTFSGIAAQSASQASSYVDTTSTSGFTLHNQGGNASTFYWMAVGK